MKIPNKSLSLLSALFTLTTTVVAGTVTPTGTRTTDKGTVYICKGQTVTLAVNDWTYPSPEGDDGDGGCCYYGEAGTYTQESTSYEWSGDASGTSASANLDTSTAGDKTATCTAYHTYRCSVNNDDYVDVTETASLAAVKVVLHDTEACTPQAPTPANPVPLLGTENWDHKIVDSSIPDELGNVTQIAWDGTWSLMKANESFGEDPDYDPATGTACGLDFQPPTKQGFSVFLSASWAPIPGKPAVGLSAPVYQCPPFTPAKITVPEFKRPYYMLFRQQLTLVEGKFTGVEEKRTFNVHSPIPPEDGWNFEKNAHGVYSFTGTQKDGGYVGNHCFSNCCPGNT